MYMITNILMYTIDKRMRRTLEYEHAMLRFHASLYSHLVAPFSFDQHLTFLSAGHSSLRPDLGDTHYG